MRDKLYLEEFQVYQSSTESQKRTVQKKNACFELQRIPSLRMRCEIAGFITHRSLEKGLRTFSCDRVWVDRIGRFLSEQENAVSLRDKPAEVWVRELKKWMLDNGYPLTYHVKLQTGHKRQLKAKMLSYFEQLLAYLEPEDTRPEHEKDRWELDKLEVPYRIDPVVNFRTINFTRIRQDGIREETKRAIYYLIQHEALRSIIGKLTAMNALSRYLSQKHERIVNCKEIDREIIEDYLFYVNTEKASGKRLATEISNLKILLELIGRIYGYSHLEKVFLQREIPRNVKPAFKAYTDQELQRLNAAITRMDEQIARALVIHQMLGTRISDTLTLERGCLYEKDGENIIRIKQLKTRPYEKPVSRELAELIHKAEKYTANKYGETKYIFINERDTSRPMQYGTIQFKVNVMIHQNDLRDDKGERFGFCSHMFRHTYGKKLTEMHLDDWTIAKLLGHSGLRSVKHYRRMSNHVLAEETMEVRRKMSEIILANLDGWEAEYEQIRHHDCL